MSPTDAVLATYEFGSARQFTRSASASTAYSGRGGSGVRRVACRSIGRQNKVEGRQAPVQLEDSLEEMTLQFFDAVRDAVDDFFGCLGIEKDGLPSWDVDTVWTVTKTRCKAQPSIQRRVHHFGSLVEQLSNLG